MVSEGQDFEHGELLAHGEQKEVCVEVVLRVPGAELVGINARIFWSLDISFAHT